MRGDMWPLWGCWAWHQVAGAPPIQAGFSRVRPGLLGEGVQVPWCCFSLTFVKHFIVDKRLWSALKYMTHSKRKSEGGIGKPHVSESFPVFSPLFWMTCVECQNKLREQPVGMTVVPFHRRSPEAEADMGSRMEEHGGLCAHTSD